MKEIHAKLLGRLFLAAGAVLFAGVLLLSFLAVKDLHADYTALTNQDLTKEASLTISYEDRLYGEIGAGIEIDPGDSEMEAHLSEFLASSLRSIENRILTCGLLYSMMISAVLAYPLCRRFGEDKRRHSLRAALTAPLLFALFLSEIALMFLAFRLPIYFPTGEGSLLLAVSLLAIVGGSCALAWLLRTVRRRVLASVLAIPLVFLLFLFGASFEGRLYAPKTVDSFDFITEIDPHALDKDYEGEVYYDDEKNVIVLNGKEYPPEQAENPDRLQGLAWVGAVAFEALSPYAGNSLFMIHDVAELEISPFILILYVLKASALIVLPLRIGKKREVSETA